MRHNSSKSDVNKTLVSPGNVFTENFLAYCLFSGVTLFCTKKKVWKMGDTLLGPLVNINRMALAFQNPDDIVLIIAMVSPSHYETL